MLSIPSISVYGICCLVFLFAVVFLSIGMLLIGFLLGGRSISSKSRDMPFESGVNAIGTARLNFSIKFYLLGMCFVVFDAEALYLYIWSIVVRESGWCGLVEVVIFVSILLLCLRYLVIMHVLDWKNNSF